MPISGEAGFRTAVVQAHQQSSQHHQGGKVGGIHARSTRSNRARVALACSAARLSWARRLDDDDGGKQHDRRQQAHEGCLLH